MSAATQKSTNLHAMHCAVEHIDGVSQHAFSKIGALASVLLALLERPDAVKRLEEVACTLEAIRNMADEAQSDINCHAEDVGCNFKDLRREQRVAARYIASQGRG